MTRDLRIVEAVRETLDAELSRDASVIVYGEDVGIDGGVFRATEGLIDTYPNQVFDSPLGEAGLIGLGVGLAMAGLTPVPEIQFQSFLYQGFHQLQQHVSRLRSRSRGNFTCPMTIRTPYGVGIRALEHHSESFEAGFAHLPGIKVVVPAGPAETKGLLTSAIRDPDPVIFLEPTKLYRLIREPVPDDEYTIPLSQARRLTHGSDITVVSWGAMLHETQRVIETIDADIEVIDLRTIYPCDTATIIDSVKRTGRCAVVHEAPRTAGFGAEITARITEEAFLHLEAPIKRITGYDVPVPLFARENAYAPTPTRIETGIRETLSY